MHILPQKKPTPVENIIGDLKCPKAFRCAASDFVDLCRARDIGLESFLLCLEEKNGSPKVCTFSVSFGDVFFCQCPLRVYIAKKLKK